MQPEGVLLKSRPVTSVVDFTREEVIAFLRERLRECGVHAAYLFGSFAAGTLGAWSDIDLIIVHETRLAAVERPREFWSLLDLGLPVDILVYTPQEFARLRGEAVGFWREFARTHEQIL